MKRLLSIWLILMLLALGAVAETQCLPETGETSEVQEQNAPALPPQGDNRGAHNPPPPPPQGHGAPPPPSADHSKSSRETNGDEPPAVQGINGNSVPEPSALADGSRQAPPPKPDGDGQNPGQMDGQASGEGQNKASGTLPVGNGDGQGQTSSGHGVPGMPGNESNMGPGGNGGPGGQGGPVNGQAGPGMPGGEMPGGQSAPDAYAAATTLTEDSDGSSYASSTDGENTLLVSGQTVTISNSEITKTGSSNSENADFYGINAAVLASDGSTLTVSDTSVTTDGSHANGIFSYGSGTTVNVTNTTITTTGNNSGGLMTTGGAAMNAENLTVSTSGNSSAAIRSDRGGGTISVSGGSYDTSGVGSPAIYSTADITVSDAVLSASASEAVVIEGGNSVTLDGVTITGSNTRLNGQSTIPTNVLIYQSMSGDAREGASSFTMTGGTMTALAGAMFHVTNVTTTITLENVSFVSSEDSTVFLDASADSWGSSGRNGGNVTLNLVSQDITGAILSDSVSSVAVNLDSGSTWTLTGDSSITSFTGDLSNVNFNGYTLYVDGTAVN